MISAAAGRNSREGKRPGERAPLCLSTWERASSKRYWTLRWVRHLPTPRVNRRQVPRVLHLTTVHDPLDSRVFHRECRSLAAAGYDVELLAPGKGRAAEGIRVGGLPRNANRLSRMSLGVGRASLRALATPADLYHFHDPELIPAGLLLRLLGKRVVYDIHEDNRTALQEREYLPSWLRPLFAAALGRIEEAASRCFHLVLAERYYADRFPRGEAVLNYARFPELEEGRLAARHRAEHPRLIYTGNVKTYRGAHHHARLLEHLPDAELFLVGRCDPELAADLRTGADPSRLHIEGVGGHVPHERIVSYYLRESWTAGLALFPPGPHTRRKELTKIFEYMAYGIPVLCADFPNLREIVEGVGCGICVDPDQEGAAAEAVRYLWENPEAAREMAARGREAARTTYNWDTQAEKLLRLYDAILKPPGP